MKRIGILTAGGDAPALNAVIRAVVKTAVLRFGWQVVGIEDGFEGLLPSPPRTRSLGLADVAGLLPRGGSILGCTNRGHFAIRRQDDHVVKDPGAFATAAASVRSLGLDAIVVLGGDGSQRIARELCALGVAVVGVPKTIDNDLPGTDQTFGFDTALGFATEAIDRLHTTAESHGRVMVVEVMGRHAGWIALHAGVAGGADVILIPEVPFSIDKAAARVRARHAAGRKFSIVVVAEGAYPVGGAPVYQAVSPGADARLGGIGQRVADDLERLTGKECRVVVLGHLQRGGSPTAADRLLASLYGTAAVRAIADGRTGCVVAWHHERIEHVPLADVIGEPRSVPADHPLVRAARDLGLSFCGTDDP